MIEKLPRSTSDERLARLLVAADATQDDPQSILYQHTVFCQTGLPYRNPGDDVRRWECTNGSVGLQMACAPKRNRKAA